MCVCVFVTAGPIIKLCAGVGRGTVSEDMCYEVLRAEARVDSFAHHALVNARARKRILCERRVARRRGASEGASEGACEEQCEPNPKPRPKPEPLRRCR